MRTYTFNWQKLTQNKIMLKYMYDVYVPIKTILLCTHKCYNRNYN